MTADQVGQIVKTVSQMTGLLIEIVNYNIHGEQYVCAGDVRITPPPSIHILCLACISDILRSALFYA